MTKRTRQRDAAGIKRGNLKTTVHVPTQEAQGFSYVHKNGTRHLLDGQTDGERQAFYDEVRREFREIGPIPRGKSGIYDIRRTKAVKAALVRIEWRLSNPDADASSEPYTEADRSVDMDLACKTAKLTDLQKEAVMLVLGEGLSVMEAAKVIGVDQSSVRSRMRWALLKLRAHYVNV